MKVYKGFRSDLTCLGYQFMEGVIHKTSEANCRRNGFHCAENPLDCLDYYPDWRNSSYYIVDAYGDINEDGVDSKISCTELILQKKLGVKEFVMESMLYMVKYPSRTWHPRIKKNKAMVKEEFLIIRGKNPVASGKRGSILGLVREFPDQHAISEIAIWEIDGKKLLPDTWHVETVCLLKRKAQ